MSEDRRCRDGDVCMVASSPFQTHFELRTTYPLAECLGPRFLLNVRHRFRVGDHLNMVRYDNDLFQQVLEVVNGLRILTVDPAGVEMLVTTPPIDVAARVAHLTGAVGEEGEVVVSRGFRGLFVVRVDGATEAERNTLIEAIEYGVMRGKELNRIVRKVMKRGESEVLFDPVKQAA